MFNHDPDRKRVYVVEYREAVDIDVYEDIYQAKVDILSDFAYDILESEEDYTPSDIAHAMLQLIEKDNLDDMVYIFDTDLIPSDN